MLAFLLHGCAAGTPGGVGLAEAGAAEVAPASSPFDWQTWGDGKAEIATYDLVQPRYGAPREGTVTLIFVTEDLSWSARVKADPGQHPAADLRPVLKLNAVRDFRTGIYDYHVMTSVFLRIEAGDRMAALEPIKLTQSVTEWCGIVFEELLVDPGAVRRSLHTYFDSDDVPPATRALPPGTVFGDALPLLVRDLRGPIASPGSERQAPYYPPMLETRFAHREPELGTATISRAADVTPWSTPAGSFAARATTIRAGGTTTTFMVEEAAPRRVLGWESSTGEHAELRAAQRLPYWELNAPGNESYRDSLRL